MSTLVADLDFEGDGRAAALDLSLAARELLHPRDPGQRTRLVVRGLDVRHISIVSLDAGSEPRR